MSVATCISRHALAGSSSTRLRSSSYAPVELGGPLPLFSRNVTLPVTDCVVMSGTTGPPAKRSYRPAASPSA
jgi:hypothetical protein